MKKLFLATAALTLMLSMTALAGQWKQDSKGWWYQNDDGSYTKNGWQNIDGKDYYFSGNGYMLSDTTTPTGDRLGSDGAKITTPTYTNLSYTADSVSPALEVTDDWYHSEYGSTYHIYKIKNLSGQTIRLTINETANDSSNNPIGALKENLVAIPNGGTVFSVEAYDRDEAIHHFNATFQVKKEESFKPVTQNISYKTTQRQDKIIVSATNNGDIAARFPEVTILFYKNGKLVSFDTQFLIDSDSELKPHATLVGELSSKYRRPDDSQGYDAFDIAFTGRAR